jgi:hypothetical protein
VLVHAFASYLGVWCSSKSILVSLEAWCHNSQGAAAVVWLVAYQWLHRTALAGNSPAAAAIYYTATLPVCATRLHGARQLFLPAHAVAYQIPASSISNAAAAQMSGLVCRHNCAACCCSWRIAMCVHQWCRCHVTCTASAAVIIYPHEDREVL